MLTIPYSSNLEIKDIQGLTEKLTPGTDVTPTSLFWFRPWLASDHPDVTCDKKYFFLYSTDHDAGAGGIYWGKGDNLDLSDFTELGLVRSGFQCETPWPVTVPGETRPFYMFFHTDLADPSNPTRQDTKLMTTTGGLLHTATWVTETNPLGTEAEDQHTGYLRFWDFPDGKKGVHLKGLVPLTATLTTYQYSTPTDSTLKTWTRGDTFLGTENISPNRAYQLNTGEFFEKYGQWWWMGTTRSTQPPTGYGNNQKQLVLAKANTDGTIAREVAVLNQGNSLNNWEPFIEDNTAHLYMNDRTNALQYATYDLRQLKHYVNL